MLQAVWKDHIKRREICVFNATKEIAYNVAETTIGLIHHDKQKTHGICPFR